MKTKQLIILCMFYVFNAYAQDLSGEWQGLEFIPGAPISEAWPSLLSIQQSSNTGTLHQIASANARTFVKYSMSVNLQKDKNVLLTHQSVVDETPVSGYYWCYGTFTLKYDEAQEKLIGTSKYHTPRCNPGTIELYRIRLKSSNEFCKDQPILLTVTGKNIKWYSDGQRNKLLATGNVFQPKISETSVFFVTQTYYGVESPVVPFIIKVRDCAPFVKEQDQLKKSDRTTTSLMDNITLKGQVLDKGNLDNKINATITFVAENDLLKKIETDANGFYTIPLKKDVTYTMEVKSNGFNPLKTSFEVKKEDAIKNIFLEKTPIEEPQKENISYVGLPEKIIGIPINYQKTITVKNREITIYPYDNEKEDGDIVSININGVWVRDKYTLKIKKPSPNENDLIKCLLNEGDNNYFISRAWNLGTIPPNTLTIKIDDGVSIQEVMINAQLGMSGGIRIVCSK